ncbi:hypothetical protein [Pseudomonas sp. S1_E04]
MNIRASHSLKPLITNNKKLSKEQKPATTTVIPTGGSSFDNDSSDNLKTAIIWPSSCFRDKLVPGNTEKFAAFL